MRILVGIMLAVFGMLILGSLTQPMQEIFSTTRASNSFNCNGYVDTTGNPSLSYNSTLPSNPLGCSVSGFGVGFLVLSIIIGLVTFVLYGEPERPQIPQAYSPAY